MRFLLVPSMCALCGLFLTGRTWAGEVHQYPECNKQPTETEIQGAKGAFQAGIGSYNEADYERATLYWEDAFRRDCTATLLLHHLARAYEGHGNLEQAAIALRTYLERTPNVPERAQLEKRLESIEQKIADDQAQKENARRQQSAATTKASTPPPHAAQPTTTDSLYVNPVIPLVVSGAGIATAVVGSIIYFPARSDLNDAEQRCPTRKNCPKDVEQAGNDARSSVNTGGAIAITGLVLAAGGVGWYFFNEGRSHQAPAAAFAQPAIQPWIMPRTAGLTWQGRF